MIIHEQCSVYCTNISPYNLSCYCYCSSVTIDIFHSVSNRLYKSNKYSLLSFTICTNLIILFRLIPLIFVLIFLYFLFLLFLLNTHYFYFCNCLHLLNSYYLIPFLFLYFYFFDTLLNLA